MTPLRNPYSVDDHRPCDLDEYLLATPPIRHHTQELQPMLDHTPASLPQLCDVRGDRCCGTPACLNAGTWTTACAHTWILDRPESDTWQCLACGTEGTGTGPA